VKKIGWENIVISECGRNKQFEGRTFNEIAKTKGVYPTDFALDLTLEEKGNIRIRSFFHSEDDISTMMSNSLAMFSTDTPTVAPYGYLRKAKVHPKAYGTFPKIFDKYVREEKVMSLEQAIRKATSFPAQKLGLKDRGIIAENMFADIVVFDAEKIGELGTHDAPHQYPRGIEYVLVNGEIVIERGKHSRKLPGRVLRRT
jgi:N-acyl-D-amino-acid deacylase